MGSRNKGVKAGKRVFSPRRGLFVQGRTEKPHTLGRSLRVASSDRVSGQPQNGQLDCAATGFDLIFT
jgi:hypothetical protein